MTLLSTGWVALSLGCTALGVLLLLRRPVALHVTTRAAVDEPGASLRVGACRAWGLRCAGIAVALVAVVSSDLLSGTRGAVVATSVLIVASTWVRLAVQYVRTRAATRAQIEVAQACSLLASQIRVGRVPSEALASAAFDCPVLAVASTAQELGGDVAAIWRARSRLPGHGGLADLARAWRVSAQTGAPLARSLEQVSEALSADQALRMVVAGELAAPRATGKIMAVLPFCGLGLGYLIGGNPLHFLMAGPYGWTCLVLGVALAAAGVLWIDRLARQAATQE